MTLDDGGTGFSVDAGAGDDERLRGERPCAAPLNHAVRRSPNGHVIAFANEKGGVGKSTLAFHCAAALAHLDMRVLAIDCDPRQQTLHRLLDARDGTVRALKVALPQPKHAVFASHSATLLAQEIERFGAGWDFVLFDLPGHDTPVARRAIQLADTVVTPVNCSPADLEALGSINPVSHRFRKAGPFAELVGALREDRVARGQAPFDWVVAKNRVRRCEHRLLAAVDRNLATMARHLGYRTIEGLTERVAYREMLAFGLCHLDLRLIPGLGSPQATNVRELRQLIEALRLPRPDRARPMGSRQGKDSAPVLQQTTRSFRQALSATMPAGAAAT